MRFQLAGAAGERGGEAANNLSRRDLGASKYPPRAKSVRVREKLQPTSSIALLGHRRERYWKMEQQTLLDSRAYARVSRKAGADASEQINIQVFLTARGSVFS